MFAPLPTSTKPYNDDSPVNTNAQCLFLMVLKWCRISSIHSRTQPFSRVLKIAPQGLAKWGVESYDGSVKSPRSIGVRDRGGPGKKHKKQTATNNHRQLNFNHKTHLHYLNTKRKHLSTTIRQTTVHLGFGAWGAWKKHKKQQPNIIRQKTYRETTSEFHPRLISASARPSQRHHPALGLQDGQLAFLRVFWFFGFGWDCSENQQLYFDEPTQFINFPIPTKSLE